MTPAAPTGATNTDLFRQMWDLAAARGYIPPGVIDPLGVAVPLRIPAEYGGRFLLRDLRTPYSGVAGEYIVDAFSKIFGTGTPEQKNTLSELTTSAIVEAIQNRLTFSPYINDDGKKITDVILDNWVGSGWSGWSAPDPTIIRAIVSAMSIMGLQRAKKATPAVAAPVVKPAPGLPPNPPPPVTGATPTLKVPAKTSTIAVVAVSVVVLLGLAIVAREVME